MVLLIYPKPERIVEGPTYRLNFVRHKYLCVIESLSIRKFI